MHRSVALAALLVALAPTAAHALVWPDVPERVAHALSASDPATRRAAARELPSLGVARAAPLTLQALSDSDLEVRLAAAEAAVRLRLPTATDAVLPWLGEREPRLRAAACNVARALPSPRAVPQLARVLGDADVGVRSAAADALGAQGSLEAVAPLLGRLDDASPAVRVQIVRALAQLGDRRAVVPLVGKVQDSVPDVRQAVARALGDLGDQRAAQALLLELRDNVVEVRVEALAALGRLRAPEAVDAIAPLVSERTPAVRQAALAALGRIGTKPAVRALIGALGAGEDAGGGLERTAVREALVSAGPNASGELGALLAGTPGTSVAVSAAWVLGELHAQREVNGILAAMRRGILPTAAAMHALAGAGTRDTIPVVLEFVGDPSPLVRTEAARAAAALLVPSEPDGRAVEPLAAALRSPSLEPEERASLALLLGRTGAPRAGAVLAGLLNARDPSLRLAAIDALGTLGPAGADDALLAKLKDADPAVRLHAAVALGDAGGVRARESLLGALGGADELDRAAVLTALGGIVARLPTDAAVDRLADALELSAGPDRDALLVAIGRARLPSATRHLAAAANGTDPDDQTTAAALLAGQAGTRDTLAALLRAREPAVRAQAAWALGAVGDVSVVPALEALTKDSESDVAIDAAAALGKIVARAKSADLARRALCPRLRDPRAYVRANALTGLALASARCGDGAELRALGGDASDVVRRSAAEVLLHAPTPVERAALDRCAASDRSGSVAATCRRTAPSAAPSRTQAVTIYVVAEGSTPRPHAAFVLELADHFLRAGTADRRGAVFEPLAPEGDVSLRRAGSDS